MHAARRSWGIVAVALFLLTTVSTATAQYSGGTGEPNDPYQIATAADLIALGETPADYDKHFILTADIDLDPNLPGGRVFDRAVIANFTGVFDGNDHKISHLTIQGRAPLGLFGSCNSGAEVKNLRVVDVNVTGSGSGLVLGCGGLVGQNSGTLTRCYSSGTVSGTQWIGGLVGSNLGSIAFNYSAGAVSGTTDLIGGLVGYNGYGGTITASYAHGSVSGDRSVGGLVGCNDGTVTQCRSTGPVSGRDEVGGLIGSNVGRIASSYSTGAVSGTRFVGGLVGSNGAFGLDTDAGVTNCYSTGAVDGNDNVGGLIGSNDAGPLTGCFYDTQTSNQTRSAGGAGRTTPEMQSAQTFLEAAWDFVGETTNGSEDIWKIAEGLGYPRLSWEKYSGGTGEPNDPYQIATAADLIALGETPDDYDKHFILTADIDLDPNLPGRKVFDMAVIPAHTIDVVVPPGRIRGQGTLPLTFAGIFEGRGHRILNLKIFNLASVSRDAGVGLFGYVADPNTEIRNIELINPSVYGHSGPVGALVGQLEKGIVNDCYTHSGWVEGGQSYVGGLVGSNLYGAIVKCHSTTTVFGSDMGAGGLAGHNNGAITDCYSSCTVSGYHMVGGLVGWNSYGTIRDSHSASNVSAQGNGIGGLVGHNGGLWFSEGTAGVILNCYSVGSVSGSEVVGGLIGLNASERVAGSYSVSTVTGQRLCGGLVGHNVGGRISACFWDTQTSGLSNMCGLQNVGANGCDDSFGMTTAEMQTGSTFLDAGWDFVGETANGTEDLWWIDEGKDYPRLWWEQGDEASP